MNWRFFNGAGIRRICFKLIICLSCFWIIGMMAGCTLEDPRIVYPNETTKKLTITSTFVGDSFPVYISLPQDYDNDPGTYYDVIYLLDGDWYFNETQKMIYSHTNHKEINPVILVGIGNSAQRNRDYTPTAMAQYPNTGGGPNYADFITNELIPYIDTHYRTLTNPENRCLAGHSLGGLFAYYALFMHNDTFRKIIAASPYLSWDNGVILRFESDYASSSHTVLPVMLYTSVCSGDYALNIYHNEILNRLKARNYSGFTISSASIAGEGHIYSWVPTFDQGISIFFKK